MAIQQNFVNSVGVFVRFNFKVTSCTVYDGAHNCFLQIIGSFDVNLIVLKRKLDSFLSVQVCIERIKFAFHRIQVCIERIML